MDAAAVRELLAELGARSPGGFAAEFLANHLSEFTLYTGWLLARGGRLEELFDVQERTWPVVWPAVADAGGVRAVVERAGSDVPLFAVHRKALTRMDPAAVDVRAGFWTRRELFADERAARRFVAEFRRAHRRRLRLHHLREAPRTLGPRVRRLLAP
jgi:hypothetical protein